MNLFDDNKIIYIGFQIFHWWFVACKEQLPSIASDGANLKQQKTNNSNKNVDIKFSAVCTTRL